MVNRNEWFIGKGLCWKNKKLETMSEDYVEALVRIGELTDFIVENIIMKYEMRQRIDLEYFEKGIRKNKPLWDDDRDSYLQELKRYNKKRDYEDLD